MGKDGGTKIFCPNCKKITVCSVSSAISRNPKSQRWKSIEYQDIHWFERGRLCSCCFKGFTTVEINKKFLDELINFRDSFSELKANAEKYFRDSNQMVSSLKKIINLVPEVSKHDKNK